MGIMDEGVEGTYTPNTAPVSKRLKVEEPAPMLMVVFRCPRCEAVSTLDAYRGVPRCEGGPRPGQRWPDGRGVNLDTDPLHHPPTRMEGVRLA